MQKASCTGLKSTPPGRLEVICGPMYSGKSEELIRQLRRAAAAGQFIEAFKPVIDNRYSTERIVSHNGTAWNCLRVKSADLIPRLAKSFDFIGIDEAQFFNSTELFDAVMLLLRRGQNVIVAGLDNTFRQEPFGAIPDLMRLSDSITRLTAICHNCKGEAIFTQRLVNGQPAPFSGETIVVGGIDTYEARCRKCFQAA